MNPLALEKVLWIKPGKGIAAAGHIPAESEFFKDHFPGFPILPGVLALEMLKQTAEHYLRIGGGASPSQRFSLKQIRATKFSMYLKPGDEWESRLELVSETEGETQWDAQLFSHGRAAVTAKLTLAKVPHPEAYALS